MVALHQVSITQHFDEEDAMNGSTLVSHSKLDSVAVYSFVCQSLHEFDFLLVRLRMSGRAGECAEQHEARLPASVQKPKQTSKSRLDC